MSAVDVDVPYNTHSCAYLTSRSVLDGDDETPYNATDCAYLAPDDGHALVVEADLRSIFPVIHTPDELDRPLHEYLRCTRPDMAVESRDAISAS